MVTGAPTPLNDVSNGGTFIYGGSMQLQAPKTYQQQIQKLKDKNIIISDDSVAEKVLQSVNYYRLKGYLLPFVVKGQKKCFVPVPIEKLQAIYEFDSDLRNLITNVVEDIEIYLRGALSYYHAHKYGSEGYMDAGNYNQKHNHAKFKKRIEQCKAENVRSLVIRHHNNKYNGKFPIWVIIEYFSIGMLSYFYKDLHNQDKATIAANLYGVNYQTLESWLRCLTDLRNRCAHYSRLYYWIFPALPKMPQGEKYVPTRRLFAQLYVLKMLYPDHDKWNKDFVKPLIKLMNKYKPYISKKHMDFPYRWKSMLKY
jgi:abortive infection bacteriophage resistance protein